MKSLVRERHGMLFELCLSSASRDAQVHDHRPAALCIRREQPMRLDDDRLVYELKPAFGLAHAFNWKCPQPRRLRERQIDVDAQPLVDQSNFLAFGQVESRTKLSEPLAGFAV